MSRVSASKFKTNFIFKTCQKFSLARIHYQDKAPHEVDPHRSMGMDHGVA
jgi:hypothetical protein